MSLRLKLIVIVLLVGLVPLGISAWTTLSLHQTALEARTTELHRKAAEHGATTVQAHLERSASSLSQAVRAIAWDTLTEEERTGALWLIFKQVEEIAAVSLLDEGGRGLGPSAYLSPDAVEDPEFAAHPRASLQLLTEFSRKMPFAQARGGELAFGSVFAAPGMSAPLIPLAVPVPGPKGTPWVIAVAFSLEPVCGAVSRVTPDHASAYVIDADQQVLCHPRGEETLGRPEEAVLAAVSRGSADSLLRFRSSGGDATDRIAAVASGASGWAVVVEQDAAVAFAANTKMRTQTLVWLGLALLFALGAGLVLAQRILRPVKQLLSGALEIAKGRYDQNLPVESTDELGQLSRAFNEMGSQVQARDHEIREMNQDLQRRVDDRTRELREAQDQLLHSQKMAAVTGLGAGFAHEINNPLTAVIGLTQILLSRSRQRADERDTKVLTHVQDEAHRIRKIVRTLLSLSQNYAGDGFGEVDVRQLVDESIVAVQEKLSQAQIEVIQRHDERLPRVRGNGAQLQQVMLNLINNSRAAMTGAGGRLVIATSQVAGQAVKIEVSDTGRGIAPEHLPKVFDPFFTTKDEWRSEGLGLTVASRVVEHHKGRIQVQSELGKGTTLTITLPAATGTHLA